MNSIFRRDLFQKKRVLVTGGGSGIGRSIAREFCYLGAECILVGRNESKLSQVLEELKDLGTEPGRFFSLDIRDHTKVREMFETLHAEKKPIDVLVNNAGGQFASPATKISANGFRSVVETNLDGTFHMSKYAAEFGFSNSGGVIINIVADMWKGMPMMAHSGAARAGVVNLTKTLALEWASLGIRVNAIAPGLIESSGLKTYPEEVKAMLKQAEEKIPQGRLGTESEVSAAVVFLASPAAEYITGTTLCVDGGTSLATLLFGISLGQPRPAWTGE